MKQTNDVLKQEIANLESQMKDSMNQYKNMIQNNNDMMTAKNLILSLNEWIERINTDNQQKNEEEEKIDIVMKQCDISRILAIKLLNDYNGDPSTAIFEYNQKREDMSTKKE